MKITTGQLAIIVVGTVLVLGIFAGLTALDKDTTSLATLVLTLAGIATGSGITYRKAAKVEQATQEIAQKVNGRMSELIGIAGASGMDTSRFMDLLTPEQRTAYEAAQRVTAG